MREQPKVEKPPLKALLIDVDGVLRIRSTPLPGAAETIAALRRRRFPFRLLTNVSTKSRAEEAARLGALGISVEAKEIYTASYLAAEYLRRRGARRCWLLVNGSAREEFAGLELTEEDADFVVLGDLGDAFNASILNRVYRALLAGAHLVAIHRNATWTSEDGPRLDVGAWVAALECATAQPALVMGKPAPFAYHLPAEELGVPHRHIGMVSDDPDVDLAGARRAGLQTILVRTTSLPQRRPVSPNEFDYMLDSIADLPALLWA